ncbi:MAG: NnrU family protein [Paracoccaceae bacterium]
MTILVLGVALWWAAHLLKSIAPRLRDRLTERMGAAGARGAIAGVVLLSVVLMVVGFIVAPFQHLYTPPGWAVHINNAAMLVAFYLLGLGHSSGRVRRFLRHPMLLGVVVWAGAHLLTNGDLAALILFGGLAAWAIVSMLLINMREGAWRRPDPGSRMGDVKHIVLTIVVFAAFAGVHMLVGPSPFPGG